MSSLSSLYIQGAKSYAQESVRVQVYDGIAWSEWSNVSLTSGRNSAPEIRELDSERAVTGELSTGIRTNERRRLSDYVSYYDDPSDDDEGTVQQVKLRDGSSAAGSAGFISIGADGVESEVLTNGGEVTFCLLYTSPSPRDATLSRMPSSA